MTAMKPDDYILFFDTETSGFVQKDFPPEHPGQPHLVQLGAILATSSGKEVTCVDLVIRPPKGFQIPDGAAKTHGITTELANAIGIPLASAMSVFLQLRANCSEIVAFNSDFDDLVMKAAIARLGVTPSHPGPGKLTCCMRAAEPVMKLPPTARMKATGYGDKFKAPNLQEAYKFFVDDKGFEGAHSALVDARATMQVYFAMKAQGSL